MWRLDFLRVSRTRARILYPGIMLDARLIKK